MKKRCGLLGRKLSHSYSPLIHSYLSDYSYELFEVEPEDVEGFMLSGCFDAINVTVPYKTAVIPYLDELSDAAKKIGSVNTVVKTEDGRLVGDNTDYYGFLYMLGCGNIDVKGKKALVLGSGGSSRTVVAALTDSGAESVTVISRTGEDNYDNLQKHADAQIIVNTTPVGMYPEKNGESPISLDIFSCLEGVVDLIFNPSVTELLFLAKEKGVRCVGGLSMLVAQAKAASERFTGRKIDDGKIEEIIGVIRGMTENIILVGMPGCGKSTVGREIAHRLGREFVDTDEEVVRTKGKSIPEIFAQEGEEAFRAYEHEAICSVCKKSGLVIATGGGAPTGANNIRALKQNGCTVFMMRDTTELSRGGRPLSASADLDEMYRQREPHYLGCADITADVCPTPQQTAQSIIEKVRAWQLGANTENNK